MSRQFDEPGFIYLLSRPDGWCRIGRTINPKQRWRQWRWMATGDTEFAGLRPVALAAVSHQITCERLLHGFFDADRDLRKATNGHRYEWFYLPTAEKKHDFVRFASFLGGQVYAMRGEWLVPGEDDEILKQGRVD